jgi:hypothetical protein
MLVSPSLSLAAVPDDISSEDNHTALGATPLPRTLTSLLKLALNDSTVVDTPHAAVVFELFRVAANLCMDHGKNPRFFLGSAPS